MKSKTSDTKESTEDTITQQVLDLAENKSQLMIDYIGTEQLLPRSADDSGNVRLVKPKDWTSGFFPGILWMVYSQTDDELWKNEAAKFTSYLEQEKYNGGTHDMGFKMFCSYGRGYELTQDTAYKSILITSANILSSRFNPAVGCIKSWDWGKERWDFPVIIDNMMNLELLFWAFKQTGDSTFYNISVSHADKTLKNHFREDYSSYHVVDYNPETGEIIKKLTHQGYADESVWARGQAWGLYGFTMCYQETKLQRYLDQAEKIANFILNNPNLPDDLIPYWDFNAPGIPDVSRDASAAAVICSALYSLSAYSETNSDKYKQAADNILHSLNSEQYANRNNQSPFLLNHSTGNKPANDEVDGPLIYADYYFLEAAIKNKNQK